MTSKRATRTPAAEKTLTEPAPPAKVPEEVRPVTTEQPKSENLLEKAKLIADLAAAWQNSELARLMKSLPNGERVFEIFSEAVNREMATIMTGKRDDGPQVQVLSKQVEQMAGAMGNFHNLIMSFMQSPLVQVLNMMNENLGARKFQFPQAPAQQQPRQAPPPRTDDDDQPSQPSRGSRSAPGLGSF